MKVTRRRVRSTGLSLAVTEYVADADVSPSAHVVLVHGYPDSSALWVPVAERLAGAGLHVVTYDVRGAGASDVPEHTSDYRTELLVDDLVAVVTAAVPADAPVHLVGHDWGSVQLWEAVLGEADDPRLRGRIASFTSVSGPALEHMGHLMRHPRGRSVALLRQLAHSWYVAAFQVPVLPELLWRTAHRPIGFLTALRDGTPGGARWGSAWGEELGRDAAHGVNLYRANVGRRSRAPLRHTDVPVLVVAPRRDPFLTAVVLEELDRVCSDVRIERPDTGHWLPRADPDLLAGMVVEQVRRTRRRAR